MSEKYGVIKNGIISFDEKTGRIEEITKWENVESIKCDEIEGDRYSIVIPGMINTHTHVPMLILQGLGAGLTGFDWLREIWIAESLLRPEDIYTSSKASIALMLLNGITTFADHYFYEEEVARAVEELGARAVLAKSVIEYSEHAPKHTIDDSMHFALRYNNIAQGRIRTMIGVHSLYSCSYDTLARAVEYSTRTHMRIHMHFSESTHEIEYIRKTYGLTPAQLALKLGLLQTNPLLAHAVYLNDEDIEILSRFNVCISYSPFTIMSWGQDIARVTELMEKGVMVSLGTDGPVTDGDLSLFKQMKLTIAAQSSRYRSSMRIRPKDALEMATRNGAECLGMGDQVGSLEPGKRADIVVLRPHIFKLIGLDDDPYATIVYNLGDDSVSDVYVDGRKLVSNGKLVNIDTEKLFESLIEMRRDLLERLHSLRR